MSFINNLSQVLMLMLLTHCFFYVIAGITAALVAGLLSSFSGKIINEPIKADYYTHISILLVRVYFIAIGTCIITNISDGFSFKGIGLIVIAFIILVHDSNVTLRNIINYSINSLHKRLSSLKTDEIITATNYINKIEKTLNGVLGFISFVFSVFCIIYSFTGNALFTSILIKVLNLLNGSFIGIVTGIISFVYYVFRIKKSINLPKSQSIIN